MNYDFLDKVVKQLVGETIIDVAQNRISMPQGGSIYTLSGYHTVLFLKIPLYDFFNHCKEVYGLTMNEIHYVWSIYRNIIKDKIEDVEQEPLNESEDKQYKYLEWVISDIKEKTYMQIPERPVIGGFYSTHPMHFFDPIDREESVWRFIYKHYETYYALTMDEMFYVAERVYPWVAETFLSDYSND